MLAALVNSCMQWRVYEKTRDSEFKRIVLAEGCEIRKKKHVHAFRMSHNTFISQLLTILWELLMKIHFTVSK